MKNGSLAADAADEASTIAWLLRNSCDLMFVLGAEGRLDDVNDALAAVTSRSREDLLGRPFAELLHPDDVKAFAEFARRAQGEPLARLGTAQGAWRPCRLSGRHMADGRILAMLRPAGLDDFQHLKTSDPNTLQALLSEAAGIGAWTYEPIERRLEMSDLILRKIGYTAEEIATPADLMAVIHPDDREAADRIIQMGLNQGVPHSFELRMRAKDGGCTTWRVTVQAEPRAGGRFALKGLSQDITELVQARDLAMRGEQQSRQIIESSPFAVAMFDRQLRYMVVSPRWRQGFGLTDREHIGFRLEEIFAGVPKRFIAAQKRALLGEVVDRAEDRFTDSHGQEHCIRWEARPWRDADGKIGGVLAYADDISALVEAREAAQTNARRLRMALEAADAGVYEIDHIKRTFWASPEFVRLVGSASDDYQAVRRLDYPNFHPSDREQVRETFREIQGGERQSGDAFETRIVRPDGKERWVRVHHHIKLGRGGRPQQGVGLVLDFDVRKRQELALVEAQQNAESAADAKAAFLANMSHEIRTPMNGVMGVLHLLKSESLSDEGRNMLEEALSCGQMLAELLNDVIDFSKIEAGHLQVSSEPLDARAMVDGVVRLLAPQAESKGLRLSAEVDEGVEWVRSDPVRLRQALFNLVGNAVKFTLQGGVVVRARARSTDGRPILRFEIEDSGVGIPLAVQPRIFQRFDQGDATTTRRFGGSGLGLAITQRLAEMMGGAVGFTSTEGQGSVFWLEILAEPVAAQDRIAEPGEACLDGMRMLVVEDNPTNRMIATKLLENLGATVETAADGLLGVEAATNGAYDLILMDVQMPGIDGLEASRRIRRLAGPSARTPIVALTANVLAHQRQAYLEAGMNGVVGKPISPADLLVEIGRLSGPSSAVEVSAA